MKLFIVRAVAVRPDFVITNANAPAVAEICSRLDGIPLAIELAAARVKLLNVDEIASRLDDRFRLLRGGHRDGLPHQQTLQALIDWSHDLLSEQERMAFRRMGVFGGGRTLKRWKRCVPEMASRNSKCSTSSNNSWTSRSSLSSATARETPAIR